MIGVGCAAFVAEADLVGAGVGPCAVKGGADGESGDGVDGGVEFAHSAISRLE